MCVHCTDAHFLTDRDSQSILNHIRGRRSENARHYSHVLFLLPLPIFLSLSVDCVLAPTSYSVQHFLRLLLLPKPPPPLLFLLSFVFHFPVFITLRKSFI